MKSIVILCGGRSRRMGKDKGSLIFKGKPMILQVINAVEDIADEIIVVLRDEEQVKLYMEILDVGSNLKIVTDKFKDQGPLIGILTGLSNIKSEYAQILPCDSPFISKEFILKMFELIEMDDFDAVVPLWDDGQVEPLHSIYKKRSMIIIEDLIKARKMNVKSLIGSLNVKYVDVKDLDITTGSFRNINRINDIMKLG